MKQLIQLFKDYFKAKPKYPNPSVHAPNPNKRGYKNITLKDLNQVQWDSPTFKRVFPNK